MASRGLGAIAFISSYLRLFALSLSCLPHRGIGHGSRPAAGLRNAGSLCIHGITFRSATRTRRGWRAVILAGLRGFGTRAGSSHFAARGFGRPRPSVNCEERSDPPVKPVSMRGNPHPFALGSARLLRRYASRNDNSALGTASPFKMRIAAHEPGVVTVCRRTNSASPCWTYRQRHESRKI
jgi:hypothetical protein